MLLDELHRQRDEIKALAHQYGARRLRIYGSVARGEETPQSDIDVLVDFPRGYDLFAQRLPLTQSLGDLLQRKVDLIPEHELNPHLRDQVIHEAIEL